MKKLIPALCMLLVAACLMGTSTYAWFAANENVKVDGMQVKAAADGGLAIASYKGNKGDAENLAAAPVDADYAGGATALWANIANNATIKPTSTTNGSWFSAGAVNANVSTGYNYTDVSTNTTKYYQKTMYRIKSLDQSGATYDLKVTGITVTDSDATETSAALNDALRIAVAVYAIDEETNKKTGTAQWTYFAPGYDADTEGLKYAEGVGADHATDPATYGKVGAIATYGDSGKNTINCSENPDVVIYNTKLSTSPVHVEVYVYYEGLDDNCTSNNALNVDTLKVEITFAAE